MSEEYKDSSKLVVFKQHICKVSIASQQQFSALVSDYLKIHTS
jgi:hypothetical protein